MEEIHGPRGDEAMSRVAVLDHGYLELVETYGSDEAIITAARQSTQKGFLGWGPRCAECGLEKEPGALCGAGCGRAEKAGDEKLLRFMWEHAHSTPFEFAGAVIEVQAPIFVFREWHRHRTQSFSEASARYAPLPDVNYIPTVERLMSGAPSTGNKQASGLHGTNLKEPYAELFRKHLRDAYEEAESLYQTALQNGVAKELARLILPVGRYSKMRASANLRNWLAFLTLRQAPNAQYEIRMYADALHDMLAEKFPRTLSLFDEGKS
jgi:thymidylate synthase (FAD)